MTILPATSLPSHNLRTCRVSRQPLHLTRQFPTMFGTGAMLGVAYIQSAQSVPRTVPRQSLIMMPKVPCRPRSNPVASILTVGSAEAPAREGKWNSGCMKAARSWNATQSADGFSFLLFFRREGSNLDRLVLITEEAPGYRI